MAAGSLYLLLFSDLFVDDEDGLFINKSSTLSDTVMGVSIGYFYHYPALGGVEYILHQAQFYIFMVLFTEITTPFVNLRWHLDVAGLKNSKLYIYSGVTLFFGCLFVRADLSGQVRQESLSLGLLQLDCNTSGAVSDKQLLVLDLCDIMDDDGRDADEHDITGF
ncbi:hypothetical protein C2S51_014257 [Perilla frutescens var. frutescens]|nr:hypothetical protein C2S51_014257 [Perilla frutescens var. frutescens]